MNGNGTSTIRSLFTGMLCCLVLSSGASATTGQEWRFRVYLDDREIGHHHFTLTLDGQEERLATRANFSVTFLKIPFFTYMHDNVELWQDDCLSSIRSTTNQNGSEFHVDGTLTDDGFYVTTNTGKQILPACISTFAYWDKSFLQRDRLLNSQTGEYLDVEVDFLGEDDVIVGQASTPARRYRLTANELEIDVWYSHDDRWLALESLTGGGRLLRYVAE